MRIFTPDHIPEYLIDQVRDKDFTTQQFYDFQKICCIRQTEDGPILNPLNFLYVLANKRKEPKGFLWGQVDPLSKDFVIQTYSVDKEYWGNGKAVKLLQEKIKEILKECSLNKVFWITNFPKHSEKYGFKRSKGVLMEYKEKEDGRNIEAETGGDSTAIESRIG